MTVMLGLSALNPNVAIYLNHERGFLQKPKVDCLFKMFNTLNLFIVIMCGHFYFHQGMTGTSVVKY